MGKLDPGDGTGAEGKIRERGVGSQGAARNVADPEIEGMVDPGPARVAAQAPAEVVEIDDQNEEAGVVEATEGAAGGCEAGEGSSSKICLDLTSMVDLTPKGPRRTGNYQKPNESEATKNDFFAVCPIPTDEPPMVLKLAGHSVSVYCEMSGWSFMHPLKFYNIHISTQFKNAVDGIGNVVAVVQELLPKCINLREMATMIGCSNRTVSVPVYVQVIAKRKVDVFVTQTGRINIIPLVVIADKSGYCVLCSFNEGLATIYNAVEVGDYLLLTSCIPQLPYRTYHRGLFAEEGFINMELKIQWHTVRSHYLRKFSPLKLSHFKMAPILFGEECSLYTPSEVYENYDKPRMVIPGENLTAPYYDVVGVISYVGRIERFRLKEEMSAEQLIDGKIQRKPIGPFILYRWIHVIDKTSKALPMKLYVSNLTSAFQDSLVPGTIVIISHCQSVDVIYSTKYTSSSYFTQIYVGGSIEKYFMMHPQLFKEKTGKLLIRANFSEVMQREDVEWSVGGTQMCKIIDKEKFFEYISQKQCPPSGVESHTPLARRESKRVIAKGIIWKVMEVFNENCPTVMYVHENNCRSYAMKETAAMLCNFLSYECLSTSSWYSFTRRLPPFDPNIFKEERSRDMVKKFQNAHRGFCRQLQVPSELDDPNALPPAARLDKVDGPPYFLIDVVNEDANKWYTCIWKSTEYTHAEMMQKIIDARNKNIFCLVDVYCVEPERPLEVSLHDFVTED